jgi:hypothetical protein
MLRRFMRNNFLILFLFNFQVPDIVRSIEAERVMSLRQQSQLLWHMYFSSIDRIIFTALEVNTPTRPDVCPSSRRYLVHWLFRFWGGRKGGRLCLFNPPGRLGALPPLIEMDAFWTSRQRRVLIVHQYPAPSLILPSSTTLRVVFFLLKINFCSHDPVTDCPSEDPPARVEGWPSVEFISRRIADTGQLQRRPSGVSVETQPATQLESN